MEAAHVCRLGPDLAPHPTAYAVSDSVLERAMAGDAAALDALIAEFRPRVFSFALSQLRQREDAEDVTQETFVRMVRTIDTYAGRGPFRAWLYRIVVNLCRDRQRRRATENRRGVPEEAIAEAPASGDLGAEVSAAVTLAAAISRLPERYREVMTLVWLEQLTPGEIAVALGRPANAVRVQLWRGRALLAKELGDWLDGGAETAERKPR